MGKINVELFGPFREFGIGIELQADDKLTFNELMTRLEKELGGAFRERALKKNTTYILNKQVVREDALEAIRISPGDRFAFALIVGGG